MLQRIRAIRSERASLGDSSGFTLIELLIMMIVLGIIAAVVISALAGETASSAASACNADAKTVELAVEAFHANPANTTARGQFPSVGAAGQAQLIDPASAGYGGPYMRTWPSNAGHYAISLDSTVLGQVDVTPAGAATPLNYDSMPNPCTGVS